MTFHKIPTDLCHVSSACVMFMNVHEHTNIPTHTHVQYLDCLQSHTSDKVQK